MKTIYIVANDFDILLSLNKWLTARRFNVRTFSGSQTIFTALETTLPDVILLDVKLKEEDGRSICKQIKNRFADKIPIILFSSVFNSIKELKDGCADDFFETNTSLHEITQLINSYINVESV